MFLYVITNLINGKQYVGITLDFARRRREHTLGNGSKLVFHAIQKYGIKNMLFESWFVGDESWIKIMEYRMILALDTFAPQGYNLTLGGEGTLGLKRSNETRKRMSEAHKGRQYGPHSDETRRKMSLARAGKPVPSRQRGKHPMAKQVIVNGVEYACIRDAAESLDVPYSTLWHAKCRAASSVFTFQPRGLPH